MGCGISSNSRIEDNIEIIKTNIKIENPKILIVQSESINIDRKKPTGYLEPDSQMNFTETNEDENQISEGTKLRSDYKTTKFVPINSSAEIEITEMFKKIEKKRTQSDYIFIIGCLKDHFLFCNLNTIELERVVKAMFYCQVDPNDVICKQGDSGNLFFILEKGLADLLVDEKIKKEVIAGQCFGDLALLYNAPRAATIIAKQTCFLWGLHRKIFRRAVDEIGLKESEENRKVIDTISFFETMTEIQKDAISTVMLLQKFAPKENIVNEGDIAASFYIIKEGNVVIIKGDKEIRKLKKGDSFGELALYYNTVRDATVRAIDSVHCLALGRESLTNILGDKIQKITFRNIKKWAFDRCDLLNKLTNIQREKLIEAFEISPFLKGDKIFEINKPCDKLVILMEGGVIKSNFPNTLIVQKSSLFGEEFLLSTKREKLMEYELLSVNEGLLAVIKFKTLFSLIGGSLEEVYDKNLKSHEKIMFQAKKILERATIPLNKLGFIRKIGSGHFGSVFLMKNPESGELFALKCIYKPQIVEAKIEKNLFQERKVLEIVNFPFIMSFIRSYKDSNYIYFLLEYVHGIELYDLIRELETVSLPATQFYAGLLLLMVEYLHSNGIIYRDFKPENLMVDITGYLKMIDLGTAKQLKPIGGIYRTNTLIGSPHYMAPEIIAGKGYTFAADLWSIGIIIYELLCESLPFGTKLVDPYEIYQQIMKKKLSFPFRMKDQNSRKFIRQLLNKNPESRFNGSYASLKAHIFFEDFDWDALFERKMKSPYIPDLSKMRNMGMEIDESLNINEELMKDSKTSAVFKNNKPSDPYWDMIF